MSQEKNLWFNQNFKYDFLLTLGENIKCYKCPPNGVPEFPLNITSEEVKNIDCTKPEYAEKCREIREYAQDLDCFSKDESYGSSVECNSTHSGCFSMTLTVEAQLKDKSIRIIHGAVLPRKKLTLIVI